MTCRNDFCIYWDGDQCLLGTIELDEIGCCRSCITVHLEEDLLEAVRASAREKFKKQDDFS